MPSCRTPRQEECLSNFNFCVLVLVLFPFTLSLIVCMRGTYYSAGTCIVEDHYYSPSRNSSERTIALISLNNETWFNASIGRCSHHDEECIDNLQYRSHHLPWEVGHAGRCTRVGDSYHWGHVPETMPPEARCPGSTIVFSTLGGVTILLSFFVIYGYVMPGSMCGRLIFNDNRYPPQQPAAERHDRHEQPDQRPANQQPDPDQCQRQQEEGAVIDMSCIICGMSRDCALDCGHLVLCMSCAEMLNPAKCPVCASNKIRPFRMSFY